MKVTKKQIFIVIAISFCYYLSTIKSIGQIIADHTFVDAYTNIPQQYIDSVKKRWISYAGESHSEAIRVGLAALEDSNAIYQVNVTESGTPETATSSHLRVSRATWGSFGTSSGWIYTYGEEDWFSNATAISRTKAGITYCNENGFRLDYFAFGWCWDPTATNSPGGTVDPELGVRWAGCTVNGTDGNKRWGLDAGDSILTGNRICTDSYLNATAEYINHCIENNYPTKVFFTTGPIDNYSDWASGESGYQQYLKYEHIRNYVKNSDFTLFDYADILSYNNAGQQQTTTWTDNNGKLNTFPIIHPENMEGGNIAHIGMKGAIKLAKAMWVLLAIEEGWPGTQQTTDTENPSIPENLKVTATGPASCNLTWNAATDNIGVAGYRIFRDDESLATSVSPNYTDNSISIGNIYHYTVAAYDAADNESEQSAGVVLNTNDTLAPSTPVDLKVIEVKSDEVTIAWKSSSDNVQVNNYTVYRNNQELNSATDTIYTDTQLTPQTLYSYRIKATDIYNNESELSEPLEITTLLNGVSEILNSNIKIIPDIDNGTISIYVDPAYHNNGFEIEIFDISGKIINRTNAHLGNNVIRVNNYPIGGIVLISVYNKQESHYFSISF